jgi:hypothetical protein
VGDGASLYLALLTLSESLTPGKALGSALKRDHLIRASLVKCKVVAESLEHGYRQGLFFLVGEGDWKPYAQPAGNGLW